MAQNDTKIRSKEADQMEAVSKTHTHAENSANNSAKKIRCGNPDKIKPFAFKPGQSGDPGGRPKIDVAAEIARRAFEKDPEAIAKAMHAKLRRGDAKVFTTCGERGYGKLPTPVSVEQNEPLEIRHKIEFLGQASNDAAQKPSRRVSLSDRARRV